MCRLRTLLFLISTKIYTFILNPFGNFRRQCITFYHKTNSEADTENNRKMWQNKQELYKVPEWKILLRITYTYMH